MNNPENTEGDIKNEQTRETDNKTKLKKTKTQHSMKYITVHYLWRYNTICVGHHYAQVIIQKI
jgi:hypothetical protein